MYILPVCRGCYRDKLAKISNFIFWVFSNCLTYKPDCESLLLCSDAFHRTSENMLSYCCIDHCASRNPLQRVSLVCGILSLVCGILYWSHPTYLFLFTSIFQFLMWFRFNHVNSCVTVTTVSTFLLLLMKFFLNPPLLNSEGCNLAKAVVLYTQAQRENKSVVSSGPYSLLL